MTKSTGPCESVTTGGSGRVEPAANRSVSGTSIPPNPLEQSLGYLWSEALDRPAVGVDEDVFLLGADSLAAAQVLAEVESVLGLRLPLNLLLEARTIAA